VQEERGDQKGLRKSPHLASSIAKRDPCAGGGEPGVQPAACMAGGPAHTGLFWLQIKWFFFGPFFFFFLFRFLVIST